jgi:adenylate cyclase
LRELAEGSAEVPAEEQAQRGRGRLSDGRQRNKTVEPGRPPRYSGAREAAGDSMAPPIDRKLTTILSADVVGYSRMMGEDEAATLATLKTYRDIMARLTSDYRGRIFNTAGDALLAEFASVVNAVECAVQIQRALTERNAVLPPERQMWFRIGINLGDVLVENDDLYGDGVNIAARLQGLAEAGGILISGTVFDQVKSKLSLGFDYLGAQSVKNIAEEVPTYRVVLQAGAVLPPKPVAGAPAAGGDGRDPRWPRVYRSAAQAGIVIAFLFAINMLTDSSDFWFQWPTLGILLVFGLRAISIFGGEQARRTTRRSRGSR